MDVFRSTSLALIATSVLALSVAAQLGCKGKDDGTYTDPPPRALPPARFTRPTAPTAPTREAAQAAHQVAREELAAVLAQHYHLHKINLSEDFRQARAAAETALARHKDKPGPRINLEYLWADPYLPRHAQDINSIMPEEVTEAEWHALKQAVYAYPDLARHRELDGAFGVIEKSDPISRSVTRKRLFRLYRIALDQDAGDGQPPAEPEAPGTMTHMQELALHLSNQVNRCIDGLLSGVGELEQRVLGEGVFKPVHLGEMVSVLATDEKAAFFRRHVALETKDPNFRSHTMFFLEQRMLLPLGLRGQFIPVKLSGHKWDKVAELQPPAMMERFINGHPHFQLPGGNGVVDFHPYNVDRLVELLQDARTRAFVNPNGSLKSKGGWRIDAELIQQECVVKGANGDYEPRDPVIGPAYMEFFYDNYGAVPNAWFEPAAPGDHWANFRVTRAFWIHILEKYGYIVP